jgi:hypothetical protein
VWNGDLPRPLQQVLPNAADSITGVMPHRPAPARCRGQAPRSVAEKGRTDRIAAANGATAIISFPIASRPGGLANEQRSPAARLISARTPRGPDEAPETGRQLEKT